MKTFPSRCRHFLLGTSLLLSLAACGGPGADVQSSAVSTQEPNAQGETTPERAAPVIRRAQ